MRFADFGFSDLTADSIVKQINLWRESSDLTEVLRYLSSKIGFDPDIEDQFSHAMGRMFSWGFINEDATDATGYFCVSTAGLHDDTLLECISQKSDI